MGNSGSRIGPASRPCRYGHGGGCSYGADRRQCSAAFSLNTFSKCSVPHVKTQDDVERTLQKAVKAKGQQDLAAKKAGGEAKSGAVAQKKRQPAPVISMTYSDLFQKIKHENYVLSQQEMNLLIEFLTSDRSLQDTQAHPAILVFCLTQSPGVDTIRLVKKFLDDSTDDYVRSAAIMGLVRIWNFFDEHIIQKLGHWISMPVDSDHSATQYAAMSAGLHVGLTMGDDNMTRLLEERMEYLYGSLTTGREDLSEFFISMCRAMADEGARLGRAPWIFISTLQEAKQVFLQRDQYFRPSNAV